MVANTATILYALSAVLTAGARHARGYNMSIESMKQAELLEVMAAKANEMGKAFDV